MVNPVAIEFGNLNRTQKIQLVKDWLDGKRIYVQYSDRCAMRDGAIAYISKWDGVKDALAKNGKPMTIYHVAHRWASTSSTTWTTTSLARKLHTHVVGNDTYTIDPDQLNAHWFFVRWEGRNNEVQASAYEIDYLPNYTGECKWVWGKKAKPNVIALDRLGREINVGDFACYILHHFGQGYGASTQFGTVQKVESDGSVWAKNVALGEDEESKLKKIADNKTIVILTKDLMDRLMIAKLSTL